MSHFELKIIEFFQQIRTENLNAFFKFLNFFDTGFFYLILISIIWIGYNWKLGIKVFFILMLSSLLNDQLKNIFMIPRPFHLNAALELIYIESYSFPSGAAQAAVLLPLIFINHFKKKKLPIIFGIIYFFLISFSRLYLGVHFLTDIIAGWILGFILFMIYLYAFPIVENKIIKRGFKRIFLSYLILVSVLLILPRSKSFIFAFTATFIGLFLSKNFKVILKNSKSFLELFIRSSLAISVLFLIYFLYIKLKTKIPYLSINLIFFVMILWISFLCPFVYVNIFQKILKKYFKEKKIILFLVRNTS